MGGGGWGGRACGARRAGGWVACLHAPPLAHGRPPLRRSPQRIEALVKCHADHPWAKYWNVCATQKILLDNCFREEKAINRWVGWVRGRVRGSGSAASQAGTQRGSSPHQPTCCLAARATLKSPSGRGSGCACGWRSSARRSSSSSRRQGSSSQRRSSSSREGAACPGTLRLTSSGPRESQQGQAAERHGRPCGCAAGSRGSRGRGRSRGGRGPASPAARAAVRQRERGDGQGAAAGGAAV